MPPPAPPSSPPRASPPPRALPRRDALGLSFFVFLILSNVATFAQTWWLSQWASEAAGGKEATWLYTGVYSGLAVGPPARSSAGCAPQEHYA